jgi:hypothetical protein
VRTLRHAAGYLEALHTPSGRFALASALGFTPVALPVDDDTRRRLDLPDTLTDAHILRGPGALRALLVAAPAEPSLRALLSRIAHSLSARTSHVLWVVIGATSDWKEVGLGCWTPTTRGPRVLALIAQRNHIVSSDAESLCALSAAPASDDLMIHTRWCELLGREALSRRFYRTLEQRVQALADSLTRMHASDRTELALLYVSRLLFLSFLETKGWLDGDRAFLSRRFDACMAAGGHFHQRVLLPLFFGTLNTRQGERATVARQFGAVPFLNGGLFTKSPFERRHSTARFSDATLGTLFSDLLGAYRFTAREGEDQWSEAAIDPEMLGRAFESLMASRVRQVSGAFYTPQALVSHVVERALVSALTSDTLDEATLLAGIRGETVPPDSAAQLRKRLRHFTVLDPACGSGAFLVYVLERLTNLHRAAGDQRGLALIRRDVLARAIHGVDVNPTAVWLCELRLWLSVVIESDETRMSAVPPLPNLDCNVRVGDTLSGDAFTEPPSLVGPSAALARLRDRYVRAAGPRKAPLRRALAREERRRAVAELDRALMTLTTARRERLLAQRSADLFGDRRKPSAEARAFMRSQRLRAAALRRERRRIADDGALPFAFPSHFGAAHARGGFDLVIGNPPWVRLHNISATSRASLRSRYTVYRNAAWDSGARTRLGTPGFAAQVDLASMFVERSLGLTSAGGCVALLLPAKLWRSLSGGGVRQMLAECAQLRLVEDWSEAPSSFDAAVYPSVVIASRAPASDESTELIDLGVRRRSLDVRWQGSASSLHLVPNDRASPWLLLPPDARHAFNRLLRHGTPLGTSHFGRAMLGVKCGCNDAFIVETGAWDGDCIGVEHLGRKGIVERTMLRPLLRGDAVAEWSIAPSRSAIVWTHGEDARPLRSLPTGAARWLAPWRRQLLSRTDLHGKTTWWSLFRTEGADHARARVVWSDFGRTPRAALLPAGDLTVPLNSCYVLACDDPDDALALTALLNGPLAAAWLNAIAEPARGGWHRYLAWTVSLLPLPRDWCRARAVLAPLAERGVEGTPPTEEELLTASCQAYRVRAPDIAPLVAWCHTPMRG